MQAPPLRSVHPSLAQGAALQQDGHLDEAAKVYLAILAESPQDFDATHLLGVIALQQERFDAAQRLIHTALSINPNDAAAMGNLGTSYLREGKLEPALRWFELALELQPDSSIALINAATALHKLARYGDAMPLLRKAHAAEPNSYTVCNLLGACLIKQGEVREAADVFETASRLRPDVAESWANLAVALSATGQTARARECADKAVSLGPNSSTARGALAAAQFDQGRVADALETYRQGIALGDPSAQMLTAYANALLASGLQDEAVVQLQRAGKLDEKNLTIRWASAIAQLKAVCKSESEVTTSRSNFSTSMNELKAWYQRTAGILEPFNAVGVNQPFFLAYQPFNNRELLSRYGELCTTLMATLPIPADDPGKRAAASTGSSADGRKLRIGFASAHISDHSVWNAIAKGWVCNIDQTKFEIHLFHLQNTADLETDNAKRAVFHFEDRPSSLPAWVEAIKDSNLDVLIYPEIGMDPLTLQLAALRLAPLQAATWGHPETTGLPTMDLYISADALEPPNAAENYSEKLLRLPNLGVYVEPLSPANLPPRLRSLNLPRNEPLLLCPGAPFKYSPLYDDVWVEIARRLKRKFLRWRSGGRLVFFRSRSEAMDLILESRLRTAFENAGVEFDTHVSLIPSLDRSRFFGLMRKSALMLDTLGFSGFNTALQAIECDLPVLAFEGDFMRGRLASAIMRQLDLPELVATTKQDFIQKSIELAQDAGARSKLRRKIIERRHVLFRDLSPVRALERHLIDAVTRTRAGSSG
jgi:protein O-GlcNAc transferase